MDVAKGTEREGVVKLEVKLSFDGGCYRRWRLSHSACRCRHLTLICFMAHSQGIGVDTKRCFVSGAFKFVYI